MKPNHKIMDIIELHEVDSTNNYCKRHMDEMHSGDVVYTLNQTAGKGTGGKTWLTKPGECLAFSIVLKQTTIEDSTLLPLLWGFVVSSALKEIVDCEIKIKWPNDVLANNRKMCGILCESSCMGGKIDTVCGIGINISQSQKRFEEQSLPNAASIYSVTGKNFEVKQVLPQIIHCWNYWYPQYLKSGLAPFKGDYLRDCVNIGKQVRVIQDSKEVVGIALGIADNGNLICEIDGKHVNIHHGEASIRGLWGYV